MKSTNIRYIPQVDQIRAFAAIWIMLYHGNELIGAIIQTGTWWTSAQWTFTKNPFLAFICEGHSAVALFMTLSGFIFTHGVYGKEVKYLRFVGNRILRIYPLYLVIIFASISAKPQGFTFDTFVTTILPLANVGQLKTSELTGMSWAVAVEFQFYLIFPFILTAINRSAIRTVFGIIAVAMVFRFLSYGLGANPRDMEYYHIAGRIDQFVLGMGAAVLLRHMGGKKLFLYASLVVSMIATFAMLMLLNRHGGAPSEQWWKLLWPTAEGIVYSFFIMGFVGVGDLLPKLASKAICKVGECSFSIYLLHFPIIILFASKHWFLHVSQNPLVNTLTTILFLVLPLTLAVSLLTYRVIELPFLSRRQQYIIDVDMSESLQPKRRS